MRKTKLEKVYRALPLVSLIILIICFIFRYSYINFLGYDRPLKLAVLFCTSLGLIGTLLAIVDGVNKDFKGKVVLFLLINLIFIFTFPLLHAAEVFLKPVENPYTKLTPETAYTTKRRDDASFILEGELYQWPLTIDDFIENGYEYRDLGDNRVSLSKLGKSNELKPTWFTDGDSDAIAKTEAYAIELGLDKNKKDVNSFLIQAMDNNWDFEIMGHTLLDSIYNVKGEFKDKLIEDPNNKGKTMKQFYLQSSDGYKITFGGLNGKIQNVEIKKP